QRGSVDPLKRPSENAGPFFISDCASGLFRFSEWPKSASTRRAIEKEREGYVQSIGYGLQPVGRNFISAFFVLLKLLVRNSEGACQSSLSKTARFASCAHADSNVPIEGAWISGHLRPTALWAERTAFKFRNRSLFDLRRTALTVLDKLDDLRCSHLN